MFPESRMARVVDAIGSRRRGRQSCVEAAELFGLSERHFRLLRDAHEAKGVAGIIDHCRGWARRAGGLPWTRSNESWRSSARAISISPPSASTRPSWEGGWPAGARSSVPAAGRRACRNRAAWDCQGSRDSQIPSATLPLLGGECARARSVSIGSNALCKLLFEHVFFQETAPHFFGDML